MTRLRFENGSVMLADRSVAGATIEVADGHIVSVDIDDSRSSSAAGAPGEVETVDLDGGWLLPGFIDTQVNGGGGALLNHDISVAAIERIGAAHAAYGTTGFMPTLISVTLPDIERALDAADAAIAAGVPGVIGLHVEGPFLNPARKGIHDERRFRRVDEEAFALLSRPRAGRVMVTVAPEMTEPAMIRRLVDAGVLVSIGHSDADYATVMAAFEAGASGVTHLYNAMSPLHHRDPGVVGAVLDYGRAWCGLIADGHHVHDAALRIAARQLGDYAMLVTDAMSSVGLVDKDFALDGRPIRVVDGRCVGEDGTLAGSDLDMAGAVRNMVGIGVSVEAAARMAATSPAAFLKLQDNRGTIAPGRRADFAWLSCDLRPLGTWIGGARISGGNDMSDVTSRPVQEAVRASI